MRRLEYGNAMKRMSSLPIVALFVTVAAGLAVAQVAENRVVAAVNESVITERDVIRAAQPRIEGLDPILSNAERAQAVAAVMRETLRLMIDDKLLRAKARSILKNHPELEGPLKERIAESLEQERRKAGGETAFRDRLRKESVSHADYVEGLKEALLQDLVMHQFVLSGLSVSRDEMLDYYETRRDSLSDPAQVKFRRLFLKGRAHGGTEETRKRVEEIATRIREGADFAAVVRQSSDGPRAAQGGLWDFEPQGIRPQPIDEILFATPIGEVGGPVETDGDFTLVQVLDRRPAGTPSFEEAQPIIREKLAREKRNARYLDFIARLERENFVEIRALE